LLEAIAMDTTGVVSQPAVANRVISGRRFGPKLVSRLLMDKYENGTETETDLARR